jgi:hypothetical protein
VLLLSLPSILTDFEENNMSLSEQLVRYILSAMISWVPLGNQYERAHDGKWLHNDKGYYVQEDRDEALARYRRTAQSLVDVALDPANPPLFVGPNHEKESLIGRVKTALQLGSIGSLEGGFHKWVEEGDCNTPTFKKNHPHECDGGAAWTNFQIHLYRYIIRDGEMYQAGYLEQSNNKDDREWIKAHKDEIITGQQLVDDPKLAAQVAYYIIRWSLRSNNSSLCGYTGESCTGPHPLALQRMNRAHDYYHNHPFVFIDEPIDSPPDLIGQTLNALLAGLTPQPMRGQLWNLGQLRLN